MSHFPGSFLAYACCLSIIINNTPFLVCNLNLHGHSIVQEFQYITLPASHLSSMNDYFIHSLAQAQSLEYVSVDLSL